MLVEAEADAFFLSMRRKDEFLMDEVFKASSCDFMIAF